MYAHIQIITYYGATHVWPHAFVCGWGIFISHLCFSYMCLFFIQPLQHQLCKVKGEKNPKYYMRVSVGFTYTVFVNYLI